MLELNSKRLSQSSRKEKQSRFVFTSSTIREILHFHVVAVMQWRQRNVQKSVMHVQSWCFANQNPLLFCRSRWRRRCRCSSSLLTKSTRQPWHSPLKEQNNLTLHLRYTFKETSLPSLDGGTRRRIYVLFLDYWVALPMNSAASRNFT